MARRAPSKPAVSWKPLSEYSYRCTACGAPGWVETRDKGILCRGCYLQLRLNQPARAR